MYRQLALDCDSSYLEDPSCYGGLRTMSTTFTPESLHRLLVHAVAPSFVDRRAADQLLFSLSVANGDGTNGALAALIGEATDRFGDRLPQFLEDLTHFWMDACARCFAVRMGQRSRNAGPVWSLPPHSPAFVLNEPIAFAEWDLFGLGIGAYLQSQAERLGFLVPLVIHGLTHPEPTVADTCWNILARHPASAPLAFPAMWSVAREKGTRFGPDEPMRGLAAMVEAYPAALDTVISALATSDSDSELEVARAVATHLSSVPALLVDAIESAWKRAESVERRYASFVTLTQIAAFASEAQRASWLAEAVNMACSTEAPLRAAAAWAFLRLDDPGSHETALLALLKDKDWWPRRDACAALAGWSSPSPVINGAVARRLGDYDGYDGEPHAAALRTLTVWKSFSAAALPEIAAWLDRAQAESEDICAESLLELLDGIGEPASVLRPQIALFLSASERADDDGEAEADDGSDPEQRFDEMWDAALDGDCAGMQPAGDLAALPQDDDNGLRQEFSDALGGAGEDVTSSPLDVDAFATRLGIDVTEDIPGTRPSAELAAEPDALSRLRAWLIANEQS
ncbi:MAG: hypothetical protein AMXMBFR59_40960 [Rhodanobacteraceae bacterium]